MVRIIKSNHNSLINLPVYLSFVLSCSSLSLLLSFLSATFFIFLLTFRAPPPLPPPPFLSLTFNSSFYLILHLYLIKIITFKGDVNPVFHHVSVLATETDGDFETDRIFHMVDNYEVCFVMARTNIILSFGCFHIDSLPDGYPWSLLFDCNMRLAEVLQHDYVMIVGTQEALREVILMSETYEEISSLSTAPLQRHTPELLTPPGSPRSEHNRVMLNNLITDTATSSQNLAWTADERELARTVNQDMRRVMELELQNLAASVSMRLQDEEALFNADTESEGNTDVEE